jgi:NADH-quinone oxidoreductase subunit C
MIDAPALEALAEQLREEAAIGEQGILAGEHFRSQAALWIAPERVREVLSALRARGFAFLASVHGVDYLPEEPRLGVHYQLLDMAARERIAVKLRVPLSDPEVPSVTPQWPTANHQEREIYDMFGVRFTGHPDLRRILMPDHYEGHPQRRDFPIGGEPVLFTYNDSPQLGTPE